MQSRPCRLAAQRGRFKSTRHRYRPPRGNQRDGPGAGSDDADRSTARSVLHALVVGDDSGEVVSECQRGREMDRVKRPQLASV